MKARIRVLLPIITMLVIALSSSVSIAAAQSSAPASPSAAASSFFIPLVGKNGSAAASGEATISSVSSSGSATSASYSPQPGDALLKRDIVFLDFTKSRLISTSSQLTVSAYLVGNLPDPCHLLRITSSLSASSNVINISVYSLMKPGTACIAVLQPFAVNYPLGTFAPGQYRVVVNGTVLGTFGTAISSSTVTK